MDPLIDGAPTFQAMEVAIAKATTSVHLAIWRLETTNPLTARGKVKEVLKRSAGAKEEPTTWLGLLGAVARLGVDVRITLADFDPVLKDDMHRAAWQAYQELIEEGAKKNPSQGALRVICSRHEFKLDFVGLAVLFGSGRRNDRLRALNAEPSRDRERLFRLRPGLWANVTFDRATKRFTERSGADWEMSPITHHQKTCVVDERIGFGGGLDITRWRADTWRHLKLWHDIHCRVEGEIAADLERNLLGRWKHEFPQFNAFFVAANKAQSPLRLPGTVVSRITTPPPAAHSDESEHPLRRFRTPRGGGR